MVVHDDVDIPFGEFRLVFERGSAGHHGVESVTECLSTSSYYRLRLGLGRPPENIPVDSFVLEDFTAQEFESLHGIYAHGREELITLLKNLSAKSNLN